MKIGAGLMLRLLVLSDCVLLSCFLASLSEPRFPTPAVAYLNHLLHARIPYEVLAGSKSALQGKYWKYVELICKPMYS